MNCTWSLSCLVVPEFNVYCPDNAFKYNIIINACINLLFALSSTILNSSVIWVIYSHERLWTPYYMILLSLATTDFTAGLVAQPLHIARILLLVFEKRSVCPLEAASVAVGYTLLAVSFFTVSYVTFERYVAVFYPYYHDQHCTRRLSRRWLIAIWIFGLSYGAVGSLPYARARMAFIVMVSCIGTVCLIWNGYAYSKIFLTSNRIRRKIRQERQRFMTDEKLVKEANAAKTTCIVVASLFVFYGPAFVTTAVGYSWPVFPKYLNIWAYTFMLVNSTANPLVYCYYCRDIGIEMKILWQRLRGKEVTRASQEHSFHSVSLQMRPR